MLTHGSTTKAATRSPAIHINARARKGIHAYDKSLCLFLVTCLHGNKFCVRERTASILLAIYEPPFFLLPSSEAICTNMRISMHDAVIVMARSYKALLKKQTPIFSKGFDASLNYIVRADVCPRG
jgi:hypothetical protein